MVRAARALLSAVTHLLVLADMSDVYKMLLQLKLVSRTSSSCSHEYLRGRFEFLISSEMEGPGFDEAGCGIKGGFVTGLGALWVVLGSKSEITCSSLYRCKHMVLFSASEFVDLEHILC